MTTEIVTKPELKIYTGQAARVLKFLQGGCNEAQAAEAVGVTPGYVSQLVAEPDFKAQMAAKLQKDFEEAIETDKNYATVELEISRKLKQLTPYVLGLDDMLKTIKVVNAAKRKVAPIINPGGTGADGTGIKTVRLILPQVTVQNFIVNPNSEVVAVNDLRLATLNASSIDSVVREIEDAEIIEQQSQPIPKLNYTLPEKVLKNVPKDKYGDL